MNQGLLLVISGPSGVGKGTLCKALLEKHNDIVLSISETTREPGPNDIHGVDYFFRSEEEFQENIQKDHYLEWAKVFKHYYGTPKEFVLSKLREGNHVLLEIDTKGAMQIKKAYPDGVFIFLAPPSKEELRNRIVNRGRDSEEQIEHRLSLSGEEMKMMNEYHYVVENCVIEDALYEIESIITAEQRAVKRNLKNYEEWF